MAAPIPVKSKHLLLFATKNLVVKIILILKIGNTVFWVMEPYCKLLYLPYPQILGRSRNREGGERERNK
jgi:hypothetical protein